MRYRLANAEARVPMPERGPNVFFTAALAGESISELDPYYARMIVEGDIVLVPDDPKPPRGNPKADGDK